MDPEKRKAIRAKAGPERELMKTGCGLACVAFLALALSGHWLGVAFVCIAVFVGLVIVGTRLYRIGPPDAFQRAMYRSALLTLRLRGRGARRAREMLIGWVPSVIGGLGGNRAFVEAVRSGPARQSWLLSQLSSEDRYDRWRAATALAEVGDESAVHSLALCLDDAEARVREAAASSLGRLGTDGALETLESRVGTDDDVQWLAVVSALYSNGRSPGIDQARLVRSVSLIRSEEELDRDRLAALLVPLPLDVVVEDLREEMRKDSAGRGDLLKVLALKSDPRAVAVVKEALESSVDRIRFRAVLSLPREVPEVYREDLARIAGQSGRAAAYARRRLKS
ncbi:MAG TPA: HEAT repeat domain-containing protein [Fimbriimonadaceae bacterium]|nr:HEAT repeat domain-containing protein [Fimbriimonadaceae bacterium]